MIGPVSGDFTPDLSGRIGMDAFVIRGGTPLHGSIRINGAKNAASP